GFGGGTGNRKPEMEVVSVGSWSEMEVGLGGMWMLSAKEEGDQEREVVVVAEGVWWSWMLSAKVLRKKQQIYNI
ncbi:hypothetical protein M8C21_029418, partial [Ambrosia artemisiifolia]